MKSQVCESEKTFLKKGTWSPEEDEKLIAYIKRYRIWSWTEMAKAAGLMRSGKSCRLRWMNYLRPGIKHGNFSQEEDQIIIELHEQLGNRWSTIAEKLPGRTDNDIKNYWNTRLKKRLQNNLVPTSSQETQTAANEDNLQRRPISEVYSLLPNSPKSSNSVGYKASPMSSTQSFTYELSSSSPDPSGEIYVNQTTKQIGLSAKYGKLQSSLQKPFPMEGLDVVESYGAIVDPGFMVPFFHGVFENEELLSSLEQPLLFKGLDTVGNYAATTDSGFRVPTIHGSFVDEEIQSSLEQLLPMTCLDMVEAYAATTDHHEFQIPTFHGGFADKELRSLLGQPFPIKRLDTVDGYGSINPEFMASTSKMDLTDEELRSLLEEPFPMAGLDMVEDFGTRGLGSGVSTSQGAFSDEKIITYC